MHPQMNVPLDGKGRPPILGPLKWNQTADVLVVGAGIAGLMASIEAHDRGASVLLIDMAESPFCGESAVCGGGMAIPGSDIQVAAGIEDCPQSLYEDMIRIGRGSNRVELVRLFTENAVEAYSRLCELGGVCTQLGYIGGHRVHREHQHDPMQIQSALYDAVRSRGIPSMFDTRAQALVLHPNELRVTGLVALRGTSQDPVSLGANATILATGGMCGNPEMIARYVPRLGILALSAEAGERSSDRPIGLGDGYKMAMAIGADTTHMYSVSTYTGIPHPDMIGYSNRSRRPWVPSYQEGAIAVNREGRRFIEETRSAPCEIGDALTRQPGETMFKVFDNSFWGTITQGEAEAKLIGEGKGYIWEAGSIAELARHAGIDGEGLQNSISRYNRSVERGSDEEFGRPREYLKPIDSPPFVAHQNWLIALHNSGGLRANDKLQIIHVSGDPIAGLFGAGEVVGGTAGEVYLTATHYPVAMTFGYLAGRFALTDL